MLAFQQPVPLPSSAEFLNTTPFCVLQSLFFFPSLLHDLCVHQLVNVACIWIGKPTTKNIIS